jgi:hypothetical protein
MTGVELTVVDDVAFSAFISRMVTSTSVGLQLTGTADTIADSNMGELFLQVGRPDAPMFCLLQIHFQKQKIRNKYGWIFYGGIDTEGFF